MALLGTRHPMRGLDWRVPRHFVTPTDRMVFAAIGLWALVLGVLMGVDRSADTQVWLARVWPVLMLAGGVLTLLYARELASFRLRGWSNACIVTACAGRGAALGLGILDGTAPSVLRALTGIALWSMVAFALFIVWRSRVPGSGGTDGWPDT